MPNGICKFTAVQAKFFTEEEKNSKVHMKELKIRLKQF